MQINKDNFKKEILEHNVLVLVDFYATWCGPCMMLQKELELLETEYKDKLKICKVNVDEQPELAMEFNISSIPYVRIYNSGNLKNEFLGYRNIEEIKNFLK